MKRTFVLFLSMFLLVSGAQSVVAAYPEKPITFIVGYAVGGVSDVSTRMLVEKMQKNLGQPIVVVNRGGAGGIVGLESVLRSSPDGYTVFAGSPFLAVASSHFLRKEPVALEAMDIVGGYMPQERCLYVPLDAPYKTWEEFVAYVKKNPGSTAIGFGASQWAMDLMKAMAHKLDLKLNMVMYASGGEVSSDFFGKHIQVAESGVGTPAYQAVREGKARILVNLGADKVPFFEDTPSLLSKGFPWAVYMEYGMSLPKGTPEPIRAKLEAALKAAMDDPDLVALMKNAGYRPRFQTGVEHMKTCKQGIDNVAALLKYIKDNKIE